MEGFSVGKLNFFRVVDEIYCGFALEIVRVYLIQDVQGAIEAVIFFEREAYGLGRILAFAFRLSFAVPLIVVFLGSRASLPRLMLLYSFHGGKLLAAPIASSAIHAASVLIFLDVFRRSH